MSSTARQPAAHALTAVTGGGVILLLEYLALAVAFDGTRLAERGGAWALIGNAGMLVTWGAIVLTAGLLTRGPYVVESFVRHASSMGPLPFRWLALHGALFGGFVVSSSHVFGEGTPSMPLVIAWALAGAGSFVALFRACTGAAWRPLALAMMQVLGSGLLLGALAWFAAGELRPLWPTFIRWTLGTSAAILRAYAGDAAVTLDGMFLGVYGFRVEVAPDCSGVEGLFVVTVCLAGYLVLARRELRFPAALLLVPIAAASVWALNAARIVALLLVGVHWSKAVALGGFHSKAGWIAVCAVALGTVALGRVAPFAARAAPRTAPPGVAPARASRGVNAVAVHCLPLFALTAASMITGLAATDLDWLYGVRIAATFAALWLYRREYRGLGRLTSVAPVLIGAIVFLSWLALAMPQGAAMSMPVELSAAPASFRAFWVALRILGSVVAVPIAEELAFRGFLQRRLIAGDFAAVPQNAFTWPSLIGSAVLFGCLHQAWVAGIYAGVAYSLATYRSGKLVDAIVAHAVTNGLIAVAVLAGGHWWLW